MHVASAAPGSSWAASPLLRWSVGIIVSVLLGALLFEAFDVSVFKRIGMAHEYCYLREPKLIWLHVISDVLIGVAYVSISTTLAFLVHRASRDIPFHWVFLAFGLFIVSCGMTHFMEVWVVWEPVYWMSGYAGGLFLPFRDATSGAETYAAGRYLLDAAKSADLGPGTAPGSLVLDFNFAFQPSCAFDPKWACPLAPPENRLDLRIEAGERFD